jgi:hypothetical protein
MSRTNGLEESLYVEQKVNGVDQLVPLVTSTSYKQLRPEANELVRSYNMSADMGGCAEVHTFTVPVLWPSRSQSGAPASDAVAEHDHWRT